MSKQTDTELLEKIKNKLNKYKLKNEKQYNNLLKWINRLISFALARHNHKNNKFRAYSRGQIVKVDFGFNVGYELGGVHYAVVITKNDTTRSGTLSVIPLTSFKNKKLNKNEVYLGSEFYQTVENNFHVVTRDIHRVTMYKDKIDIELDRFHKQFGEDKIKKDDVLSDDYFALITYLSPKFYEDNTIDYQAIIAKINEEKLFYENLLLRNQKLIQELKFMKPGSVAKVEQLRIVSKNRIISPRHSSDALHGVKVGERNMDTLNNKLKEVFIFDK
ncbi:hypothetical protein A1D21_02835 [Aerococcus loyolae]|uniref:Type II toxin-antitoxin system PemK/MazF family toxin n=1 Tax=Aerococcus loyolae TaxID=2976809 RepID=A0ABT4BXD3_9LACT|nr:type II toxin-antitoxin system PemK/MazF family toxin [Aerococcus loyolae]MCY3024924.1 type II toxin-antitoxin system PemK/MazF family toxin [Aerococcus loyolae]MCY3028604.1 type II toxin-antitoxin system PemK/MazF family toxin [Aerococcus loyolae]OAM70557.1 hypothetical protein A1D21_02835 [Aerococcus loyolae]